MHGRFEAALLREPGVQVLDIARRKRQPHRHQGTDEPRHNCILASWSPVYCFDSARSDQYAGDAQANHIQTSDRARPDAARLGDSGLFIPLERSGEASTVSDIGASDSIHPDVQNGPASIAS